MIEKTDIDSQSLPSREVVEHEDGRVELVDSGSIEHSQLFNEDLAPVPVSRRQWTTYNFAALWSGMAASIPTYMLSSGLIAQGMNWWQALLTILIGNVLVLLPILANSHPGTKYGIPFPVFARASYGVIGSNLPALMRAVVACGWFGIQTWIGGQALDTFMAAIFPGWHTLLGGPIAGHRPTEWLSFAAFWWLNIYIIFHGMDLLRKVENLAAPFVLTMTSLLVAWALYEAKGLGQLLTAPGKFPTLHQFIPIFIPSVMAMMGYWSTLSLNMPDFTRFGKSQREQIAGQVFALPTVMTLFAAMGVIVTSAATVIYPAEKLDDLWDPIKLIGHFDQAWIVAIAMFTVVVATLAVNIAANVVSPANDFANAFPKYISFRKAGLITGIIGIFMQPWKLLADPSGYIFAWLLGYSGGLGSIAGVMIVDYWVIRKRRLNLPDLYLEKGAYTFSKGWHWPGVIATLAGCAFAWIGLVVPVLKPIYDFGWFAGFAVSALVYLLLMAGTKSAPAPAKTN